MATLELFEMYSPTVVHGRVKRCSQVLLEKDELVVYLHLEEQLNTWRKWREGSLIYRLSKETSLNALLVQVGDTVTVEWIPNECKRIRDAETVAFVTNFHLGRDVDPAFGNGFHSPLFCSIPT